MGKWPFPHKQKNPKNPNINNIIYIYIYNNYIILYKIKYNNKLYYIGSLRFP